jgi:hypothetical protein
MRHGPSALPITRYLKPSQVQPFLDAICSLTFRLWLTGAKIGERRQSLTDCGNQHEIAKRIDYDYKARDKVLVINEGILQQVFILCGTVFFGIAKIIFQVFNIST